MGAMGTDSSAAYSVDPTSELRIAATDRGLHDDARRALWWLADFQQSLVTTFTIETSAREYHDPFAGFIVRNPRAETATIHHFG